MRPPSRRGAREIAALAPGARAVPAVETRLEAALEERLGRLVKDFPSHAATFRRLDVHQQRAVLSTDRALAVRAQVGSGKTTVLVHRVLALHLLDGVPLERIAVLTFTRKAAEEIRGRLASAAGLDPARLRLVGTFHGVARRVLEEDLPLEKVGRRAGFEIVDEAGRQQRLLALVERHGLRIAYRKRLDRRLEAFKNGRVRYGSMKRDDDIAELVAHYDALRREENVVDFDDLVEMTVALAPHWDDATRPLHVAVDEFQDSDERLVDFLAAIGGRQAATFVVGDPNQTIYSWRGTAVDVMAGYVSRFAAAELTLPVNYRSSATIVGAASRLLAGFTAIVPTREAGDAVRVLRHHDSNCEAAYVAGRVRELQGDGVDVGRMAVLVRLREQLTPLQRAFEAAGVSTRTGDGGEGVALLTLHASKGLEFDWVYLAGANDGLMPLGQGGRDHRDEEQRLFFVGLTRARDRAEIGWLVRPDLPRVKTEPSPFIARLGAAAEECSVPETSAEVAGVPDAGVEAEAAAEAGRRVSHPSYGEGVLVSLDGDRMVCRFPKRGEKAFSASFSPVQFLD